MVNVTDTLMKHPPASQEDREAKQARDAELVKARSEYMALDQLVKHGWHIVKDKLQDDEFSILAKLELSQDPTTLAKLVGSLLACKAQQDWPTRRMADLVTLIQDLEAQE